MYSQCSHNDIICISNSSEGKYNKNKSYKKYDGIKFFSLQQKKKQEKTKTFRAVPNII